MKIREAMTTPVIRISPEENVTVAARTLQRYNIGALPVCGPDGKLCGMITDRDIVTRCLASGRAPAMTQVRDVMTAGISAVRPDMDTATAAALMSSKQIRRLPVMENGKLCGIISLGDLAVRQDANTDAVNALAGISSTVSRRE